MIRVGGSYRYNLCDDRGEILVKEVDKENLEIAKDSHTPEAQTEECERPLTRDRSENKGVESHTHGAREDRQDKIEEEDGADIVFNKKRYCCFC